MSKTKSFSKAIVALLVLAMVLAMAPVMALAWTDYDLITVESGGALSLAWSGNTGTLSAVNTYVPDQFTLYVEGTNSVSCSSGITIRDSYVESSNHEDFPNDVNTVYTIGTSGLTVAGTLTITVTASNHDGVGTYTINVPKPTGSIASGAYPASVVSYLPIGQFATGNGWGSASGKFVSGTGYASTGVSLGGLGGYIEFDFGEDEDGNNLGLSENAKNPYGVDFVVYGNAFGGNPEAGAVQVSENGTTWYELAGSLYYDGNFQYQGTQTNNRFHLGYTGVLRNADVIYTLNSSNITAVLKDAAGTVKVNGDLFTTATAWWPTATEYADSLIAAAHQDTNVTIARSGSTATSTLAYGGVTAIPDSDTTAYYAFGYADVTPNGSPSTYGNAINPYTPYTSSKTGGDGFDLSWAVDIDTGEPVDVTGKVFRYVRVYSAVLDTGFFGETSAEVCGIFATANPVSSATAGTTDAPTITVGGTAISSLATPTTVGNVKVYDLTSYSSTTFDYAPTVAASGETYVYVNSKTSGSVNVSLDGTTTQYVRVIAQNGTTAAPSITLIKIK